MRDLALCLCTLVQKGRVGPKTPSHFLLQLQNRLTSLICFFLHACFVNTGSVLPPALHMHHYIMREVKLVQDEHLWLKSIEIYIF